MSGFAVVIRGDDGQAAAGWGPIDSPDEAADFAAFASAAIGPAAVVPLRSPAAELLRWRAAAAERTRPDPLAVTAAYVDELAAVAARAPEQVAAVLAAVPPPVRPGSGPDGPDGAAGPDDAGDEAPLMPPPPGHRDDAGEVSASYDAGDLHPPVRAHP